MGPEKASEHHPASRDDGIPFTGARLGRFRVIHSSVEALFSRLSSWTGIAKPRYPDIDSLPRIDAPDHPVVAVTAKEAEAFCSFAGGRLPTREEWKITARAAPGGEPLSAQVFPWGSDDDRARVNLMGDGDPWRATSPVDAFPLGRSPSGLLNLSGNVSEWTATSSNGGLRFIQGGCWAYGPETGLHHIDADNLRDPRDIIFSTGFRCLYDRPVPDR